MDKYSALRSLHPLTVLAALGVDTNEFRKRSGKPEWHGKCPIHQSKTNQTCFSVHEDGRFRCFSCEAKGRGGIDIVRAVRKVGFQEAVSFLEGLTPRPQPESPVQDDSAASGGVLKPLKSSYHKFKEESAWLSARIPSPEILEHYGVFAYHNPARKSAYSHKIMIPIKGMDGEVYGYLARTPEPKERESKYFFPKNFPKSQFVFGVAELKDGAPHKLVYVCESPFTTLKFASLGLKCVSLYGWSASDEQIQILRQLAKGAVYLPDRDKWESAQTVCAKIAHSLWVRMPELPEGIDDPEKLNLEQILAL